MNARSYLAIGSLLALAVASTVVFAQQPTQEPRPLLQPGMQPGYGQPYSKQGPQPAKLAEEYVKADKEETKKEIRKKLADVLSKQFDQHIEQQQKELDELEKQVTNLKAILKKRVDGKGGIIDRRIEQLLQDAQGLGWNVPATPGRPAAPGNSSSYAPLPRNR